jgi:hypothetical protein
VFDRFFERRSILGEVTQCPEVLATPHQLSAHFGLIVPTSARPLDSGHERAVPIS